MFSAKTLGWSAVVCVAMWGAGAGVMHLMAWHYARDTAHNHPGIALTPQALTNTKIAGLGAGFVMQHYGYSMQVPWSKVADEKDLRSITILDFAGGANATLWDPKSATELFAVARGESPEGKASAEKLYGSRALSSNYEFTSASMHTTGADVSLWQSSMKNLRTTMLLLIKPTFKATVVYEISAGHLRGFQIGDPRVAGTTVRLLLFDEQDREIQLWLRGPGLTQEQVNGVVASIHAVS